MKSRFIPMVDELKELLNKGIIGHIKLIENAFCYDMPYNNQSYIYDKNQGGALYDVGMYNIAMIIDLIPLPLLDMKVEYEKQYDVDVYDKVILTFDGCQAVLEMATMRDYNTNMRIVGDKGFITCSPFYRPTEIIVNYDNG
ncbi:MAG: hypothetical protein LUF02_01505 [Erysipelotrichaceae bacterium]|nr:hypothetical protein [Erysipelotrichaceae bacterium]